MSALGLRNLLSHPDNGQEGDKGKDKSGKEPVCSVLSFRSGNDSAKGSNGDFKRQDNKEYEKAEIDTDHIAHGNLRGDRMRLQDRTLFCGDHLPAFAMLMGATGTDNDCLLLLRVESGDAVTACAWIIERVAVFIVSPFVDVCAQCLKKSNLFLQFCFHNDLREYCKIHR